MRSKRAAAPCGCCPGLVVARLSVLDCRAGRVERISGHGPFLALMCMLLHRQACAAHPNNLLLRMYSAQGVSVASDMSKFVPRNSVVLNWLCLHALQEYPHLQCGPRV